MNLSNKQKLYINVILLFLFTYLLASKVIVGFKTNNVEYLKIGINAFFVIVTIFSVIKYANIENKPK